MCPKTQIQRRRMQPPFLGPLISLAVFLCNRCPCHMRNPKRRLLHKGFNIVCGGASPFFIYMSQQLDIFETLCPWLPSKKFKNFEFFKTSLKMINVYFGERTVTFGERTFTFGEITFTFGDNRGFRIFLFLLGDFGTLWVGGPRRGFRQCLSQQHDQYYQFAFPTHLEIFSSWLVGYSLCHDICDLHGIAYSLPAVWRIWRHCFGKQHTKYHTTHGQPHARLLTSSHGGKREGGHTLQKF